MHFELEYRAYAVRMKLIRQALETGFCATVRRQYFVNRDDPYTVYMRDNRTGQIDIAARVRRFYMDDMPEVEHVDKKKGGAY